MSRSRSSPLRSGRLTSRRRRSNGFSPSSAKPASPVSALEVEYPSILSRSSRPSLISDSSSTTRMEPLDMNRFPSCGEFKTEGSAFALGGAHVDLSRVLLDNAVAHRKSQPRAAAGRFRGEEGVEDAMQVFVWNTGTGVGNFDLNRTIVRRGADL